MIDKNDIFRFEIPYLVTEREGIGFPSVNLALAVGLMVYSWRCTKNHFIFKVASIGAIASAAIIIASSFAIHAAFDTSKKIPRVEWFKY